MAIMTAMVEARMYMSVGGAAATGDGVGVGAPSMAAMAVSACELK